jgi:chromosome partitioning protein
MIISIASQKGGTGKTTTSLSLAAGLARRNAKVLLIDIDSQANSSKVLLPHYQELRKEQTLYQTILESKPLIIHPTTIQNLSVVPAHILLADTDMALTTALDHREARLKRQLDEVEALYDYVFIDCPPALSWLTINAFTASDGIIVTIAPGYFELDSVVQISKSIQEVRGYFNPSLQLLGFLFTMSDSTTNSKTSLKVLRQTYPDSVLRTIIPRNTDIRDAHFSKQDIFTFSPQSRAAEAYTRLIDELFYEKETE